MDRLQKAASALLEHRVPIPDKECDYVVRVYIRELRDALEAETNRRDKQAEELDNMADFIQNLLDAEGKHRENLLKNSGRWMIERAQKAKEDHSC
jgi:hypothetical protein